MNIPNRLFPPCAPLAPIGRFSLLFLPIALHLPDSLAIDDDSEEYKDVDNDFEELVFYGTKWFPRSKYVRGRKLLNVRDLEDSPASNEMSPLQLTA